MVTLINVLVAILILLIPFFLPQVLFKKKKEKKVYIILAVITVLFTLSFFNERIIQQYMEFLTAVFGRITMVVIGL